MNRFVKGALLLMFAAFLGECLEFIINVVLAKELGEEGLGLYMSIFPTIAFIVVIASLELPISISKFVAEKEPIFHYSMLKHALWFATLCTVAFTAIALFLFPLIPVFEKYHPFVKWLFIVLIPVITFSSVARGYFMGAQKMAKIAVANFIRRAVQLGFLVLIFHFFDFDLQTSILIGLCAVIVCEMAVLAYLILAFVGQMKSFRKQPRAEMSAKKVRKSLLEVSLPTTGLRIFHAATFAIKPFLIKAALVKAGMAESMAIIQYGKLAGVAFTIGFFPAFIAHSLLIVLIPTVSEAYSKRNYDELHNLLRKVLMFTGFYGFPIVAVFYLFAGELTTLFFENSPAAGYLQLLVPYFLFHYFVIPMQAYLIGLGLVKDAFIHSVITTAISFVMMFMLGAMPAFGMSGVILGMNMSAVLLTFLHYATICKKLGLSWTLKREQLGDLR
ncbi:polysaccharide biosynthesis protein [Alkalihalobacillus pseudalcaliphilus]|uniref:polysaccharide biosynthesis protein n=1 Tax=Alkalihalobacillus pseudalcaliphilus TaxID=79884 RepID=UPI00064E0316|nr:polysaccharide biosynthesis protein [Alkalihalobacillus pseudalcaliphilus]KMK75056.1 multidrug transporter MatE [Alkalihalobacillus pseudalcaliphilus]